MWGNTRPNHNPSSIMPQTRTKTGHDMHQITLSINYRSSEVNDLTKTPKLTIKPELITNAMQCLDLMILSESTWD